MLAKRETKAEARKLRKQGMAITDIAKVLEVAKSSVSLWVRDIELTPAQVEVLRKSHRRYVGQYKGSRANADKQRAVRLQYQLNGRERASSLDLHLAGCLLYWAEGAKARNEVYFVNSDPEMMKLFIRFLREEFSIPNEDLTLYITCHFPDRERQEQVEQYWLDLLQLDKACLRKTQVKKGSEFRVNTLVNGVCGLRVAKSTWLVQHIYGAIQEYAGFENPDWLN